MQQMEADGLEIDEATGAALRCDCHHFFVMIAMFILIVLIVVSFIVIVALIVIVTVMAVVPVLLMLLLALAKLPVQFP